MAKGGCLNAVPLGRLGELWTLNIGLLWLNGDETGMTLAPFSACCGGCARCTAAYCVLSGPKDLCKNIIRGPKRELDVLIKEHSEAEMNQNQEEQPRIPGA